METKNITFIGAGNMARALMVGLLSMGYAPDKLTASNPRIEELQAFQQQFGIHLLEDNCEAASNADIVVLAVKPKVLPQVCEELKETLIKNKSLVISIAAGIPAPTLSEWLDPSLAIVRAMPNTPVAVSAGATGLFANDQVSEEQKNMAEALFRAVGVTVWADAEKEMDLITAVSGSGPAYYFLVMEAMQEAAQRMGLREESARLLSLQTVLGAARMAMESQHDVSELRRSVTSPNGTTEAAIRVFENGNIKQLFGDAMEAAFQRAQELAEEIKKE